jgi:hypothetical protein
VPAFEGGGFLVLEVLFRRVKKVDGYFKETKCILFFEKYDSVFLVAKLFSKISVQNP